MANEFTVFLKSGQAFQISEDKLLSYLDFSESVKSPGCTKQSDSLLYLPIHSIEASLPSNAIKLIK